MACERKVRFIGELHPAVGLRWTVFLVKQGTGVSEVSASNWALYFLQDALGEGWSSLGDEFGMNWKC